MDERGTVGRRDLGVKGMGFGGNGVGGDNVFGNVNDERGKEVMGRGLEGGVNFIDRGFI